MVFFSSEPLLYCYSITILCKLD